MTAWLDHTAAGIDQVDQVIRAQLRAAWRERRSRWSTVTLDHGQATTLLQGIIPSAIASTPRRAQHARLAATLHQAGMQLLRLNGDPGSLHATIEAPIAAVLDLAAEAREWVRQVRWSQATAAAGVRGWRAPVSISSLNRLLTLEQTEAAPDARRAEPSPLAQLRQLAARSRAATQQLDLPLPPPAQVIDLRQLQLVLPAAA